MLKRKIMDKSRLNYIQGKESDDRMSLYLLDENMIQAHSYTKSGVTELRKAVEYQKSSRKRLFLVACSIPVVVALFYLAWVSGIWVVIKMLGMLALCGAAVVKSLMWLDSGRTVFLNI